MQQVHGCTQQEPQGSFFVFGRPKAVTLMIIVLLVMIEPLVKIVLLMMRHAACSALEPRNGSLQLSGQKPSA